MSDLTAPADPNNGLRPVPVPPDVSGKTLWMGIAYGLAAVTIWGAWPVASRFGVGQTLTAPDITFLRFLVAGLMLSPLVIRRGHGGLGWGKAIVLAIGAGAPYTIITVSGFSFAPAGHGGLIIPSTMLTCSTIGGAFILGDRPNRQRLMGLALVLGGVVVTGSAAFGLGDRYPNLAIGHLMFVGGGMCWSIYTIFSRKWAVDSFQATALVSVLSLIGFTPVYLIWRGDAVLSAPISEILFQGIAQGVFSAVLALILFTRAVGLLGAGRGAVFAALVPGFSALFAYPALGEVPGLHHLVGLGLVSLGMALALGLIGQKKTH